MRLQAYITLFAIAACLPLLGVPTIVGLPLAVVAGGLALRAELLALLGLLVRVKPTSQFDSPIPAHSKPL